MTRIHLEAQQTVAEEEEIVPPVRRQPFNTRKGIAIFSVLILVEVVVLFFFVEVIRDDHAGAGSRELLIPRCGKIEVGPVAIIDEDQVNSRADRHFSCTFDVFIKKNTYEEIMAFAKDDPHGLDWTQRTIEEGIRGWLLDVGGAALKNKEMQRKLNRKLLEYLQERQPELNVIGVFVTDLTARR